MRLTGKNLTHLPPQVEGPHYDRTALRGGIVHLGLGGFARAHILRFTHDLIHQHGAVEWGVVGAGLMPADAALVTALNGQDGLYTLAEHDGAMQRICVIGALKSAIYAGDETGPLLAAMDSARIVSLTITEHGYCLDRASKRLDMAHPLIAADLADPQHPRSTIGVIVQAYARRLAAGKPAFTALSCDNIQHNGDVLRGAVLDFAERCDPELAEWIAREGRFPNSMVDRITPVPTAEHRADVAKQYGILDAAPVFCEAFKQWVIEDSFADGRPAWQDVGAQFVADVTPYEFMKLRLLNASHLAIAGLGRLMGYVYIHEAMADDRLRRYMMALMSRELAPTLLPVAGVDLPQYSATLAMRFANPAIRDRVERVNSDAPLNVLVDPIRDRIASGAGLDFLALGLAAWLRRMRGVDETGAVIAIQHPLAELLCEKAIAGGSDPRPMLEIGALFGDMAGDERLVSRVGYWLGLIYELGATEAMRRAEVELGF